MQTYYDHIPALDSRVLTVTPNDYLEPGKLILVNSHGMVESHPLETGAIVDETSIKSEYLKGCFAEKKLVFIGTWQGGGMGRAPEIQYRAEIQNAAGGEPINLSHSKWFSLLRDLAVKDASNSHNKQGVEK